MGFHERGDSERARGRSATAWRTLAGQQLNENDWGRLAPLSNQLVNFRWSAAHAARARFAAPFPSNSWQNPGWIRNVAASPCHVRSSCIAGIMAKDQGASAPKMLFHSMDELDLELRL